MTVLGDWDEELDPGELWVVSQGSNGEGGKKGKKGKKRWRKREGGTIRMLGELLFTSREEAEAHIREALGAGDDGDNRDDGDDEGDKGGDKGEGRHKGGEVGGDKGVRRKGTKGVTRGVPGARMSPGNPPPRRRGNLCVATRKFGHRGAGGLIGLTGLIELTHHQVTRRRPAN